MAQGIVRSDSSCTIRVFYPGTTTLIPASKVFANETGTTKGNPFMAAGDSMWSAFIDQPDVDVNFSGGGIGRSFTLSHYLTAPTADLTAFGAQCNGATDDFNAMNTASLTMGTAGAGKLIIPAGKTCVVGTDLRLSRAITLVFENGGKLAISTDVTLTIEGRVDSPARHIFTTAGTGEVIFGAGTRTEVAYPEWWGAASDGTAQLHAFQQVAKAVADGMTISIGPGTYNWGDLQRTSLGMQIKKNHIVIAGAGRGVTKLQYVTHPNNGCFGTPICVGTLSNGAYVDGITLRDLSLEDNSPQSELGPYGFPGASGFVAYGVTNVVVQNVEWINPAGNSPIQMSCGVPGDPDGGGHVLIDHIWIHSDSSHRFFAGVNWGSCSDLQVSNSKIEGKFISGAIGGGEANRRGDLRFINNYVDATLSLHGESISCIGPGGTPNNSVFIINNTCHNFDGANHAIFLGNETGGRSSDNSFKYVEIRDNVVSSTMGVGPGNAINLGGDSYGVYEAVVAGNSVKGIFPIAIMVGAKGVAGPGVVNLKMHGNTIDAGNSSNGELAIYPYGFGTCQLPEHFSWRIHSNHFIGFTRNVGGHIYRPGNATCLADGRTKIFDNDFNIDQYAAYFGSHSTTFSGGGIVANGDTREWDLPYEGVVPGDRVRVLGMTTGLVPLPHNISVKAAIDAPDTVHFTLTNNTGRPWDTTGSHQMVYIVERPD